MNVPMQVRIAQRVAQPARLRNIVSGHFCCASPRLQAMPSKVLLSARPETYAQQIGEKRKRIEGMFANFNPPELQVFESEKEHYRMRSEFRVWHEDDQCYYIMFDKAEGNTKRLKVTSFSVGSVLLNDLMVTLMKFVQPNQIMKDKLYQVNFHTTLSGESMVTLIYHKKLDAPWMEAAAELRSILTKVPSCTSHDVQLLGRSRKQKVKLGNDHVDEVMTVFGKDYSYRQVEGAFSQPNGGICVHMLEWAKEATKHLVQTDLLELYCGNGNFTVALAENFRQVIATEVSKASVHVAQHNIKQNNVKNASIFRVSSEEFTSAWKGQAQLHRLETLDFQLLKLETILVDPPRAGLDDETVQLLKEFKQIVYVSCNPDTLHDNLLKVADTHTIKKFALFDQFPYTDHIECGVYLERKAGAGMSALADQQSTEAGPPQVQQQQQQQQSKQVASSELVEHPQPRDSGTFQQQQAADLSTVDGQVKDNGHPSDLEESHSVDAGTHVRRKRQREGDKDLATLVPDTAGYKEQSLPPQC